MGLKFQLWVREYISSFGEKSSCFSSSFENTDVPPNDWSCALLHALLSSRSSSTSYTPSNLPSSFSRYPLNRLLYEAFSDGLYSCYIQHINTSVLFSALSSASLLSKLFVFRVGESASTLVSRSPSTLSSVSDCSIVAKPLHTSCVLRKDLVGVDSWLFSWRWLRAFFLLLSLFFLLCLFYLGQKDLADWTTAPYIVLGLLKCR